MKDFAKDRDKAFIEFVQTDSIEAIKAYADKYGIKTPENEDVLKAGIYKAVQECTNIPQEIKDMARTKCIELGFKPTMWG